MCLCLGRRSPSMCPHATGTWIAACGFQGTASPSLRTDTTRQRPHWQMCCSQCFKRAGATVQCLGHLDFDANRDENGSDTDGYHRYHICFHISGRIRIRIWILLIMSDKIQLDVDNINIWFKYSNTDTLSDVEYSDSDTDRSEPL